MPRKNRRGTLAGVEEEKAARNVERDAARHAGGRREAAVRQPLAVPAEALRLCVLGDRMVQVPVLHELLHQDRLPLLPHQHINHQMQSCLWLYDAVVAV